MAFSIVVDHAANNDMMKGDQKEEFNKDMMELPSENELIKKNQEPPSVGLAFGDLIRIKINKESADALESLKTVAVENQFAEKVIGLSVGSK